MRTGHSKLSSSWKGFKDSCRQIVDVLQRIKLLLTSSRSKRELDSTLDRKFCIPPAEKTNHSQQTNRIESPINIRLIIQGERNKRMGDNLQTLHSNGFKKVLWSNRLRRRTSLLGQTQINSNYRKLSVPTYLTIRSL